MYTQILRHTSKYMHTHIYSQTKNKVVFFKVYSIFFIFYTIMLLIFVKFFPFAF